MTETTKTPNPLKQARREKREARAIMRFIEGYRDTRRSELFSDELKMIRDMIGLASIRVQEAGYALAALKADEVTK